MELFNRIIILNMGNLSFQNSNTQNLDGFDIDFTVPFKTSDKPDVSEVLIYNLKDSTINAIKSMGYIILNAGYQGQVGTILTGNIEDISTKKVGLEKETRIMVTDGAIQYRTGKLNKTYKENTKASYIMNDLILASGLKVGEINPKNDIIFPLGKVINGYVESNLKQLTNDTGSKMYIKDQRVYIKDKSTGLASNFVLKADTGLIGNMEVQKEEDDKKKTKIKYSGRAMLNFNLNKDSIIKVESKNYTGYLRLEEGKHTGAEFETHFTGIPIGGK